MTDEALFVEESAVEAALSSFYGESAEALKRYVDILASRGIEWGLLGPREGEKLWGRHIANSLALDPVVPEGVSLADVGSGAGLPGLPLAIVRPDLEVYLVEPMLRRAEFLELAVEELDLLDRVRVIRTRAEDYSPESGVPDTFDVVTCRAVAPLGRLLSWTAPLFYPDGELVALKGRSAEGEIERASKVLRTHRATAEVLELSGPAGTEATRAIRVRPF